MRPVLLRRASTAYSVDKYLDPREVRPVGDTISVGQLRQNPTQMLRDVKAGATYTITDHGEPVAQVTAVHRRRWVSGGDVHQLLAELGADADWERQIADVRTMEDPRDLWSAEV